MRLATLWEGAMTVSPAEAVPPVLGRYRLLAELGQGGMARVFLAVAHGPSGFSKLVVLKMIRMHLIEDPDAVQMFLDEARLAGRLNHPNVVHTHEVVEIDGRHMMVMEYLEGQSLASVLKRASATQRAFPQKYQLRTLLDALQGLHYAHTLKDFDGTPLSLVHRDISPQNIFITYDGVVKVLDFGIAKAVTSSTETKAGVIKGKIAYMAPEQFLGEPVDSRADVFSVGTILWHVAAGQRLWRGVPDVQVISRVIRGEIPKPSAVNPHVDPELERITMKALAIDREARHPTALALHDDLEAYMDRAGEKTSTREVGSYVAEMFDDLRKRTAQTIERQLSKAQALDTSVFERSAIPELHTTSGGQTPGGNRSQALSPLGISAIPPGMGALTPGEDLFSGASRSNVGVLANSIPGSGLRSRKPPWLPLFAMLGIVAGVAAALFLIPALRTVVVGAPAAQVATSSVVASASPPSTEGTGAAVEPPAASVEFVDVAVEARPGAAVIFFDGEALPSNPATRRVKKDGAVHRLLVEAPGYETKEIEVAAERDTAVAIALERATGGGRVAATSAPRGGHEVAATEPTPGPVSSPPSSTARSTTPAVGSASSPDARDRIKNLDKSNPWEQ